MKRKRRNKKSNIREPEENIISTQIQKNKKEEKGKKEGKEEDNQVSRMYIRLMRN